MDCKSPTAGFSRAGKRAISYLVDKRHYHKDQRSPHPPFPPGQYRKFPPDTLGRKQGEAEVFLRELEQYLNEPFTI